MLGIELGLVRVRVRVRDRIRDRDRDRDRQRQDTVAPLDQIVHTQTRSCAHDPE